MQELEEIIKINLTEAFPRVDEKSEAESLVTFD